MKLLRMTATFGRLDHETLTLTDGLNLLQLPNEAGKSTWAEFLLAMFYGVDTSEREKTGVLPVKTKYQPWNGKAMEGTIELEQDGRRITLTRTSAARAPMSVFSAVYTDSGLPVEGLTGANCGERLLGVPKSVYQRSAFVRQAGLGLTPDESLESRLSALVTTGDETVSYAAADKRLQAWQNRVKHNKTGLIPDAERAIAAVEENLQTLAGEHQKNLELHAQLQQLQLQKTNCEVQLRALEAAEAQQKRKRLYDAKLAALQASNRENAAAAQCARLPQEGTLQTLSQEAAALLRSPEPEKPAPAPEKPKKEHKEKPKTSGSKMLEKKVRALEREIEKQEALSAELDTKIEAAAADYQELARLMEEKQQAEDSGRPSPASWRTQHDPGMADRGDRAARRGLSGAAAAHRHDGRVSAASGGGAAGAADPPKKGRAEGLEPDPHRADGCLDGGHLRRDGLYQRAGKGQRHGTRRNTGLHRRARRTGPGRRTVADAQKASGQGARIPAGTPGPDRDRLRRAGPGGSEGSGRQTPGPGGTSPGECPRSPCPPAPP